jgi:hypothetical protein
VRTLRHLAPPTLPAELSFSVSSFSKIFSAAKLQNKFESEPKALKAQKFWKIPAYFQKKLLPLQFGNKSTKKEYLR